MLRRLPRGVAGWLRQTSSSIKLTIAPARRIRMAWAAYGTATLLTVGLVGGIGLASGLSGGVDRPARTPLPPAAPLTGYRPADQEARPAELSTTPLTNLKVSVTRSYPFIWPVTGPITSPIGPDHPTGIDIGLDASRTQGIRASAGGTVAFSGGSDFEDYGLYIVLDHGGGISTLYAHLAERLVAQGVTVEQGELIGIGGSTGKADGMHLHFEVHSHGATVDPLKVLPLGNGDSSEVNMDCALNVLVVDAGSQVLLDFTSALGNSNSLREARLEAVEGGLGPSDPVLHAESPSTLMLRMVPNLNGPSGDADYKVVLQLEDPASARSVMECYIIVRTTPVAPSFFVRNTPTASPRASETPPSTNEGQTPAADGAAQAAGSPEGTATRTTTPTRTPTMTPTPTNTPTPRPKVLPTAASQPARIGTPIRTR